MRNKLLKCKFNNQIIKVFNKKGWISSEIKYNLN